MNTDVFLLIEIAVIAASVAAHAFIAYGLAPRKAKQGILDALTDDSDFQTRLMGTLVVNFMKPMKMRDENGNEFIESPVKLFSKSASTDFKELLEQWLGGKQSATLKAIDGEIVQAATEHVENPMLGLALQQIPTKWRATVFYIAQMLAGKEL